VHVFNLVNHETYHTYCWLTKSPDIDTEKMATDAVEYVMNDPGCETPEDALLCAPAALSYEIRDLIEDRFRNLTGCSPSRLCIGELDTDEPLFAPLLSHALDKIDCVAIAKALLLLHDKASPDDLEPKYD